MYVNYINNSVEISRLGFRLKAIPFLRCTHIIIRVYNRTFSIMLLNTARTERVKTNLSHKHCRFSRKSWSHECPYRMITFWFFAWNLNKHLFEQSFKKKIISILQPSAVYVNNGIWLFECAPSLRPTTIAYFRFYNRDSLGSIISGWRIILNNSLFFSKTEIIVTGIPLSWSSASSFTQNKLWITNLI